MKKMKKKVAFIGTGGRAGAYTRYGAKEQMDIVGIADVSADNRKLFLGLNNLVGKVSQYDNWRDMYDQLDIDGVVISTPNHQHVEPAVEAMKRGWVVALEKPVAESPESCKRLLKIKNKFNAQVIVGFVLRSAPFYKKAEELVRSGAIGEIISMQADEIPAVMTTSVMFRSDWRRFKKTSGGSLLEKACHDMDMLSWIAGSKAAYVSSFAGRRALRPNPDLPERCDQCNIRKSCIYYLPPEVYNHPDQINKANDGLLYRFTRDNSACIYNNGHDIYDHQSVQIEYENGILASFVMDFSGAGKSSGRHIKIIGTKGSVFGRMEDNEIHLHDRFTDNIETFKLTDDGSGHGGANRKHVDVFIEMMNDRSLQPGATLEAGFDSAMLCFAADKSVEDKCKIDFNKFLKL